MNLGEARQVEAEDYDGCVQAMVYVSHRPKCVCVSVMYIRVSVGVYNTHTHTHTFSGEYTQTLSCPRGWGGHTLSRCPSSPVGCGWGGGCRVYSPTGRKQ